jgi:hypothetical protein
MFWLLDQGEIPVRKDEKLSINLGWIEDLLREPLLFYNRGDEA